MRVLGIESSCDETAASVVEDGRTVLSSVIASQIEIHQEFGGVVPEIASRSHVRAITSVTQKALDEADLKFEAVDAIAATRGPGLIGCVLVGLSFAKGLAFRLQTPFVGVNHIAGHISALYLDQEPPELPVLTLVASGGHTHLYLVKEMGSFELIAQTMDDAAGEAFDKVGKLLGLPYPAGPHLDRLAQSGNPMAYNFPRPVRGRLEFSFSGLKTAMAVHLKKNGVPSPQDLPDLLASFQEAIVDSLLEKIELARKKTGAKSLAIVGGVAANSRLRTRLQEVAKESDLAISMPSLAYCTDNAAMIASAGYFLLDQGERHSWALPATATLPVHS